MPGQTVKPQWLPSALGATYPSPVSQGLSYYTNHQPQEKESKLKTHNLNAYHFPIKISLKNSKPDHHVWGALGSKTVFSIDVITVEMSHQGGAMMRKDRCSYRRRKKRTKTVWRWWESSCLQANKKAQGTPNLPTPTSLTSTLWAETVNLCCLHQFLWCVAIDSLGA